jgi:hypothetical protein
VRRCVPSYTCTGKKRKEVYNEMASDFPLCLYCSTPRVVVTRAVLSVDE